MKSKRDYWEQRYKKADGITSASVITEPKTVNERAKEKFAEIVISVFDGVCISLEKASVLAAGCGNGVVSEALATRSKSLYGFDFSRKAIKAFQARKPTGSYVVATITDIPFQTQFDVVTAFSILYHLIRTDTWQSAIEELSNVTRNGGYLALRINWSNESLGEQSPESHFYDRSRNEYIREFERNSLDIVDVLELPVKPMILDKLSVFPGGDVLKSAIAPAIVAGDLFKKHENKLVLLQKET